jgi:DNA-binding transcriptional ArsR family regulator
VVESIQSEFVITQPAVSQHLRVLRDAGFVSSTPAGSKRIYRIEKGGFYEVDTWLESFRSFWEKSLDALGEDLQKNRAK